MIFPTSIDNFAAHNAARADLQAFVATLVDPPRKDTPGGFGKAMTTVSAPAGQPHPRLEMLALLVNVHGGRLEAVDYLNELSAAELAACVANVKRAFGGEA